MPKPIKFSGRVADDGTPSARLLDAFQKACARFAGREVTSELKDKLRSNSANAYYWGVVVDAVQDLFREMGYPLTPDQVHEWLKRTFLGTTVIEEPDPSDLAVVVTREVVGSTRTDAWTFQDYVMAIETHEPFVEAGLFIEPSGKLRGRTIHEPGGTKVTFRDPKAEAPEADEVTDETTAYEMQLRAAELW